MRGGLLWRETQREPIRFEVSVSLSLSLSLCSGRHKQEDSLFEEMLQVSQAVVSQHIRHALHQTGNNFAPLNHDPVIRAGSSNF